MDAWLVSHPQDRFGRRTYALGEYSLTRDQLVPVFAEYLDRFDIRLEEGSDDS